MKPRVFSLTVLLLASVASGALAQDRSPRTGDDAGQQPSAGSLQRWSRQGQSQGQWQRHEPAAPEARPAPTPAPAPAPPQAPRPDERAAERGPPQAGGPRGPGGVRVEEHDRRVDEGRVYERRGDDGRGDNRFNGRDRGPDRRDSDHRGWDRHDDNHPPPAAKDEHRDDRRDDHRDRRWDGRWDDQRGDRGDGGRDWNRDWNRDRDRDRDWDRRDRDHDRRDHPRWEQRRYPPIYNSPSRYRGPSWRPPRGYYVRSWRFGEILPRGWYEPEYRILDWWAYDLPEPPYGYDWVRVGPDVLLIDSYTGRIVQVVRLVFW
jgi:Ni/Co efflux regulator RcnB